ncbi:MAG: RNA methyltransferase, partial [Oscillibacter sp.]|nr:RNA methyltransferase [Oscillibacter sp.]
MSNIIELTDFSAPELDVYARLNERQVHHCDEWLPQYAHGEGLFIAESPNVIQRALDGGYEPVSLLLERRHIVGQARDILAACEARTPGIPVYTAETEMLSRLTGFVLTRGVLCAMKRRPLRSVEDLCADARRIAVLEDVMNPTNVGAIFRSAAALGMDAVLLTPGCSDPLYRRSARVSMGAVFQIPWTRIGDTPDQWPRPGMDRLRAMGFRTAAMALRQDAVPLDDPSLPQEERLAILLGTEGDGLAGDT